MNRWKFGGRILAGVVMAIALALTFSNTSANAVRPTLNNCIEFRDKLVCPDNYCEPDSFTCDSTGKQCYCRTNLLSSAEESGNKFCEIAAGSNMLFERDYSKKDLPVKHFYLYGGIWQAIIDRLKVLVNSAENKTKGYNLNDYGIQLADNKLAFDRIVFTPVDTGNINLKNYYASRFLTLLAKTVDGKLASGEEGDDQELAFTDSNEWWEIGFLADDKPDSSFINIHTQSFGMKAPNGQRQVCSVRPRASGQGFQSFLHKLTPAGLSDPASFTSDQIACVNGLGLLSTLVLPYSEKGWFGMDHIKQSDLTVSRNCAPVAVKTVLFIFKDKQPIPDMSILAGNMLVTAGSGRTTYELAPKNLFMGQIFEENDSAASRKQKVEKIRETYCRGVCVSDQAKDYPECVNCDEKASILNQLEQQPAKSFVQILYSTLADPTTNADDPKSCGGINPSFGATNELVTQLMQVELPMADYRGKQVTEAELNGRLPNSLINVCQDGSKGSINPNENRIRCKQKALVCYEDSMKPDLKTGDICRVLDGKGATTKWAFCPFIASQAQMADQLQKKTLVDDILSFKSDSVGYNAITAWSKFRDFSNILVVIGFLIIIFSQLTGVGLSNYQIKKMLPKIIVVVILINISMYAMRLILDVAGIISSGVPSLLEEAVKESSTKATFTDVISGILAGTTGGALIALGGLAFMIPLLISALVGLASFLIVIALRHMLIIVLIVISPIAIASLLLPEGKWFNKWLKVFLGLVAIYPLAKLLESSGQLIRNIILSDSGNNPALRLAALVLPTISIFLLPAVIKGIIKNSSSAGAKFSNFMSGFGKKASDHHAKSYFGQSLKQNRAAKLANLFGGNIRSGRGSWLSQNVFGRINRSSGFNILTSGAGTATLSRATSTDQRQQNQLKQIIGNDTTLLNALLKDNGTIGSGYASLNLDQQQRYKLVMASGGSSSATLRNLTLAAPNIMASAGVFNVNAYRQTLGQARSLGASNNELVSSIVGGLRVGLKKGDTEIVGLMQTFLKAPGGRSLAPSSTITNTMSTLQGTDHRSLNNLISQVKSGVSPHKFSTGDVVYDAKINKLLSQGITERDFISAAVLLEASSATANIQFIEKNLSDLGRQLDLNTGNKPLGAVDDKGKLTVISQADRDELVYMLTLHEAASAENSEKISLTLNQKNLEDIYSKELLDSIRKEAKNTLPSGWTEDRDMLRIPDRAVLEREVEAAIQKTDAGGLYSQMFNSSREGNDKLGIATDSIALPVVRKLINNSVEEARKIREANPGIKDQDLGEHMLTETLVRLGYAWKRIPVSEQKAIQMDVEKAISSIIGTQAISAGEPMENAFAKIGVKVEDIKR